MKRPHSNRAILILESPWELDDTDANRTSVLPFIEGVAKHAGDTEVFHANFYDKKSFSMALECLCKTRYRNAIVYVAAHGSAKEAGGTDLFWIFAEIAEKSRQYNISGVLLGACFAGASTSKLEACIEDSAIRWCAGYASSVFWLPGTMIDCAILAAAGKIDVEECSREGMIEVFAEALSPFAPTAAIGLDADDEPVDLEDSLQFVIQPPGRGIKAANVSADVFEELAEYH